MKLRNVITKEIWNIPEWRTPAVQEGDICFFAELNGDGKLFSYKSLDELNKEWEDYKPAEPLIKDEKIRKAVRAWADAGGLEHFTVVNEHFNCCKIMGRKYNRVSKIEFLATIPNATHRTYTIAELCGEEEE